MSLQDEIADEYLPDINVNGMDCPDTESAKDIVNKVLDAAIDSTFNLRATLGRDPTPSETADEINKLRPES